MEAGEIAADSTGADPLRVIATFGEARLMAPPRWLRIAPLGRPVVPEVYISVQGSAGSTLASGLNSDVLMSGRRRLFQIALPVSFHAPSPKRLIALRARCSWSAALV
jgi:hypothetical protein